MNLFAEIRALVIETLEAMARDGQLPGGLDMAAVTVEPPRDPAHGDMATNAAMVLAKPAAMAPRASPPRTSSVTIMVSTIGVV